MTKLDRRVQKTLQLIDTTCYTLLATTPFDKLSVAAICTQAQLGRSTFYQYYLDKYDWLEKQVALYTDQFKAVMQQRQQDFETAASLTTLVTALLPDQAQLLVLFQIHTPTADLTQQYRQILATTLPHYVTQQTAASVPLAYLQELYATNALTYIQYTLTHGQDARISAFMNQSFNAVLQQIVKPT
ncbi:TetR/AcrR family transcriptional regulator [Lactiplantibacillus daowaiensis]|uniref:TetR/AcrR family transcriptional regulator n=1 Tax=Lactiplantibacillus daowaiensis TaxID=2559918 RepID=A0ABW1S2H6_9LACO|nr:TetR/AcrR family transcriptional regulator [Lactiplantibacillus daowaiensis]